MKVGEVIVKEGKASVITKMESSTVKETVTSEEYIKSVIVIKDNDDNFVTIKEFIDARCEDYINGVEVHVT